MLLSFFLLLKISRMNLIVAWPAEEEKLDLGINKKFFYVFFMRFRKGALAGNDTLVSGGSIDIALCLGWPLAQGKLFYALWENYT